MTMTKPDSIRIIAGALDESELRGGTVILRGVIDKTSLPHLRVDDYQREALPLTSLKDMIAALKKGDSVPDIEIGMRGQRCGTRGDVYSLNDHCYIIDGQQRVNAALAVLSQDPAANIRIGGTIHFGTTREWERERFRILNSMRSKVSPNVLLRNAREDNAAIGSLFGLSTNDRTFALYNKVAWGQTMKRGELTTALSLVKITARLHSHKSAGRSSTITELGKQIERLGTVISNANVRANVKTFFDVIDACYGIKLIQYREMAPHMRGVFLMTLSAVFSDHFNFWNDDEGKKLFVDVDLRRKLQSFPLHDPSVAGLISSSGKAGNLLYQLIVEHLNKGKRSKHLQVRAARPAIDDDDIQEEAIAA